METEVFSEMLTFTYFKNVRHQIAQDRKTAEVNIRQCTLLYTRWFKYDRDYLCVNKSQFVPVIFEPPCIIQLPNFFYKTVRYFKLSLL